MAVQTRFFKYVVFGGKYFQCHQLLMNYCFRYGQINVRSSPGIFFSTCENRHSCSTISPSSISRKLINKAPPKFEIVQFMKENMEKVLSEIPEFKYYIFNEQVNENPYMNIPLDQPILDPMEESEILSDLDIERAKPEVKFSMLENGLRIASIDKYGLTSCLGLFVNTGSRFEDVNNFGVCDMIEKMAFNSTAHLSWLRTIKTIEALGANAACTIGRESIVYSADCLRQYMPIMISILTGNVLFPRFLPWEISRNSENFLDSKKKLESNPDALITELLHTTAWHNNTLGHKLYATEKSMSYFNADTMRNFMLQHFSPDNMVFVGVNVVHSEFCTWIMRAFVDYNAIPSNKILKEIPKYTGGDCRYESAQPFAHLAIAFETEGGWNSDDLLALTILQSIMGGGGSFSTGGPGKGMYTRLFLNVLNENDWVESCMAFNAQYSDSGLFGIFITAKPSKGADMVKVACKSLLSMTNVTSEEMKRAKNSLKSSIWMNLECRQVVMEDIARQLLMSNCLLSGHDFCREIDNITEDDITRAVMKMLLKKPTVVAYGDISSIPHYDDICKQLKQR